MCARRFIALQISPNRAVDFSDIFLHGLGLEAFLDDIIGNGRDGLCLHVLQGEASPGLLDLPLGHRRRLCTK